MFPRSPEMPSAEQALPGRSESMPLNPKHFIHGRSMVGPFPSNMEQVIFGMGCFWGAEQKFWSIDGVHTTAVGYTAGYTLNPTYQEVCSGMTGHNEAVLVVYDPALVGLGELLEVFWESHNPTEGMRQGNDQGTQYRSGIYYCKEAQLAAIEASLRHYQQRLTTRSLPAITTEIKAASEFYYAEEYHQQYLAKNPGGYCGLGGTGVRF